MSFLETAYHHRLISSLVSAVGSSHDRVITGCSGSRSALSLTCILQRPLPSPLLLEQTDSCSQTGASPHPETQIYIYIKHMEINIPSCNKSNIPHCILVALSKTIAASKTGTAVLSVPSEHEFYDYNQCL